MNKSIEKCQTFSTEKMSRIREELANLIANPDYAIVTGGSFARGEASSESDLDYFLICDSPESQTAAQAELPKIVEALQRVVTKAPSPDGAFGQCERIEKMALDIGGQEDHNTKITRRVLFLLEGEWLYNQPRFKQYRDQVLCKYINPGISDHQFCRFLLNDLIRYYRTICVDFEHKTTEAGKSWGDRNIKLIFSRKLLYFSGVLVAAETWQHTYTRKMQILKSLLDLTPINRIQKVCGARADTALSAYDKFLEKMADRGIRSMLEKVPKIRGDQPPEFRDFKNEGHHFSWLLAKLLKDTYDESHPIHNALVV